MIYWGLALAWAIWAVGHSLLVSESVRRRLAGIFPLAVTNWRLFHTLVSLATMAPILIWSFFLGRADRTLILDWPNWWLPGLINLLVLIITWSALRQYKPLDLSGWATLRGEPQPEQLDRPITTGVLGWVRHPLYLAGILVLWGHNLNRAGLTTSAVLTAYLLIGTLIEEHRLAAKWGQAWNDYRAQVSALLPWKRIKTSLVGGKV